MVEKQPEAPKVEFKPTHAELVDRAVKYLKVTRRCGVVFHEFKTWASEIPDAIGWRSGGRHSILIECKASRSDFLADKKKSRTHVTAKGWAGMGKQRYYLCPPGIIAPEDVPPYWGLLIWNKSGKVHLAKESKHADAHLFEEISVLYSACRRGQLRGIDLMFKGDMLPGQRRKRRKTLYRRRRKR